MKLSKPLVMTVSKMNALLKKLGNNSLIKFEAVSTTFLELLLNNAGYVGNCSVALWEIVLWYCGTLFCGIVRS